MKNKYELDNLRNELYKNIREGKISMQEASKIGRKILGLNQPEFAKLVKVSQRALADFERGVSNPTVKTLNQIFAPYGIEIGLKIIRQK